MSRTCETCFYFTRLGFENSGLLLPDKSGPWMYAIGRCTNAESVHSGRDDMAEFVGCWLWKKKRRRHLLPTEVGSLAATDTGDCSC